MACFLATAAAAPAVSGSAHTYIKYEGRGGCEALDADIREHFEHVALSACHVDESERRTGALRSLVRMR